MSLMLALMIVYFLVMNSKRCSCLKLWKNKYPREGRKTADGTRYSDLGFSN